MDENLADTAEAYEANEANEAYEANADMAAFPEGSAEASRDRPDEAPALDAASAAPGEPEPDVAEDPTIALPTPVATEESVSAGDLTEDAPTSILPAVPPADISEEAALRQRATDLSEVDTLRQPARSVPRRVPPYSQPLRGNPFFLYRAPDLLRDANDPSVPPPPGLKWAYNRRQVRWYLRSAEEGPLASRPWIWVLLLFAGVFALAVVSRLIGG
jgi:hypothetical protein